MIVTGALAGPIVKSSGVIENGLDVTSGVGSILIMEQLTSGVGVIGTLVGSGGVGVEVSSDVPQAERRNPTLKKKIVIQNILRMGICSLVTWLILRQLPVVVQSSSSMTCG